MKTTQEKIEMNKEAILKLADRIEAAGRFNLATYIGLREPNNPVYWDKLFAPEDLLDDCNTVACVCGWQNAIMGREDFGDREEAAKDLGLTWQQASELFIPDDDASVWGENPYSADATRAVKLLRDIANGEVEFTCDNR